MLKSEALAHPDERSDEGSAVEVERQILRFRITYELDYQEARLSIHELGMAMYFRMRDEALATLHES